jgi:hypothetical protein
MLNIGRWRSRYSARPGTGAAHLALLLLFFAPSQLLANSETYRGVLVPELRDPPIPVVVELDLSKHKISGVVTTSAPMTARGPITWGEKQRSTCNFQSDIGAGYKLSFEGYCLSRTIEGTYTVQRPDGSMRRGTYLLFRQEPEIAAPKPIPAEPARTRRSTTSCLAVNSTCVAACPRGDYNAEFLCVNRCRQQLNACKSAARDAAGTSVP